MQIILEDERPHTWNKIYGGKWHWSDRREYVNAVHMLVDAAVREINPSVETYRTRVHIKVIAYFDKYPHDPDNIPAKLYIDGLRHAGVIENDTRKYVASVTMVSEIDRDRPRVEIFIEEE
jgi:Holliday junction resolvase RusA-like endonuclease